MIGDGGVDLVFIERVDKTETAVPGLYQYVVLALIAGLPRKSAQYSTVNEFVANQCLWGRDCEWPLLVRWKRGAYGLEIVSVEKARRNEARPPRRCPLDRNLEPCPQHSVDPRRI